MARLIQLDCEMLKRESIAEEEKMLIDEIYLRRLECLVSEINFKYYYSPVIILNSQY